MLLIAMRAGDWETAQWLLASCGASASCREKHSGDGPLHIVAEVGAAEQLPMLMLYGALPCINVSRLSCLIGGTPRHCRVWLELPCRSC